MIDLMEKLPKLPNWIYSSLYHRVLILTELTGDLPEPFLEKNPHLKKTKYITDNTVKFNCLNHVEHFIFLSKKGKLLGTVSSTELNEFKCGLSWITAPVDFEFKIRDMQFPDIIKTDIKELKFDFK